MTQNQKFPLQLDLSCLCNNRCVFCAQGDLRHSAVAPVRAQVSNMLAAAAAQGRSSVVFVGGEPTMHDDLAHWIQRARDLSFQVVAVQTNGRRLAVTDYAKTLVDAGVTHVEVSLQGPNGALHDYHTQTPGSFRETAKGLLNVRDTAVHVGITTVVTRSNFRHLDGIVAMAQRVGASAWHVCPAEPIGAAAVAFQRIIPNLKMVMPVLKRAADRCQVSGIVLHISGMPVCVLGDLPECERIALSKAASKERAYTEECGQCPERAHCPGVSSAYARRFGLAELNVDKVIKSTQSRPCIFPFAGIGEQLAT